MTLTCPKCHGLMRQYERAGVIIDQCAECRGIFLDRGELEHLVEAEASWVGRHGGYYEDRDDDHHGYRGSYHGHHKPYHGKKRRKSFLEELFD